MDRTATYDRDELEKKLHDPTAPPIYLPIQFLEDITCKFSREQELGCGGFGVVYKGVLRSGKTFAVKKIFDIHLVEDEQFQREVSYLMGIKHQNIVQLVGYCAESCWEAMELPSGIEFVELPKRLLCFEYLCNGSLDKYVSDESSGLDWYKRFEIIKGICSGLLFLHEEYIVHLDLKPENILMDGRMMPKVADFGLSRLLGADESGVVINGNLMGSLGYMAPEYITEGIVSAKADIFSFGVVIIEIITGGKNYPLITVPHLQPFGSHRSTIETSIQHYIEDVLGRWKKTFKKQPIYTSPEIYTQQVRECIAIALRCVDPDRSKRPNAREIFQMLSAVTTGKRGTRQTPQNHSANPMPWAAYGIALSATPVEIMQCHGEYIEDSSIVYQQAACDGGMCADTRGAMIRDLVKQACEGPLAPTQQEKIVLELGKDWKLFHHCGMTPQKLPGLVEHNPLIAVEVFSKLINSQDMDAYFDVLLHMEKGLHLMEVVNRLATVVVLPPRFIRDFISNCIRSCKDMKDKYMQNRQVRLVSVFLQSLVRNKIINLKDHLFIDILVFCIDFPRIREAAGLFRLLESLK